MFTKIYGLTAVATLALGSAAFGQQMIGDQELTPATLPSVTEHCETLASGADEDVVPGNSGNVPAADNDIETESGSELGSEMNEMTEPGNTGNPETTVTESALAPDPAAVAVPGNSGNADAESSNVAGINLSVITLEECQAAGL